MDATKHILYILKHNPWGRGGGCYACRCYLEALSEVFSGAEIDACVCAEYLSGADEKLFPGVRFIPVKPRGRLQRLMIPFTRVLHRHHNVVKKLLREQRYDYVVFDHNAIAGSLAALCRQAGARTIVINHNCEVEYFGDNTSGLMRRVLLPVVRQNERRSYLDCDINIFLTEEDRHTFARIYGQSGTMAVVGGCFLPRGTKTPPIPLSREIRTRYGLSIVISGTIGNVQNMDGINHFLDELYPTLPDDVGVVITGQRPPEGFGERLKAYRRVTLVAEPDDILAVVNSCDIFLCPTRTGGGMKLRIIDGLRCGLPVVAHSVSARGYTHFKQRGMVRTYTTVLEFARVMQQTIDNVMRSGRPSCYDIANEAWRTFAFEGAVARLREAVSQCHRAGSTHPYTETR